MEKMINVAATNLSNHFLQQWYQKIRNSTLSFASLICKEKYNKMLELKNKNCRKAMFKAKSRSLILVSKETKCFSAKLL
jgi:hypothetical protein